MVKNSIEPSLKQLSHVYHLYNTEGGLENNVANKSDSVFKSFKKSHNSQSPFIIGKWLLNKKKDISNVLFAKSG